MPPTTLINIGVINVDTKNKQLLEDTLLCILDSIIFLRSPLNVPFSAASFRGIFSFPKSSYKGVDGNIEVLKDFSADNGIEHGEDFTVKFIFAKDKESEEWCFNFKSLEVDEKGTASSLKDALSKAGDAMLRDSYRRVEGGLSVGIPHKKTFLESAVSFISNPFSWK